ncbi:hypothetical protein HJC23_012999 [Cyclotella cryptica]|uniref:Uncharacterized protein n=1 Tax=Cyclotella cryptica TaxID=29204 RepID=A0ABD3QHJ0_9STRA
MRKLDNSKDGNLKTEGLDSKGDIGNESGSDLNSQEDSTFEQEEEPDEDSTPVEEPFDNVTKLKYWSRATTCTTNLCCCLVMFVCPIYCAHTPM